MLQLSPTPFQTRFENRQSTDIDFVSTSIEAMSLFQAAISDEDGRYHRGEGDSEGIPVSRGRSPARRTNVAPAPTAHSVTRHSTFPATLPAQPSPSNTPTTSGPAVDRGPGLTGGIEVIYRKGKSKTRRSASRAKRFGLTPTPPKPYRPRKALGDRLYLNEFFSKFQFTTLPIATGGWIGKRSQPTKPTEWTMKELFEKGFDVIPWDGV